MRIGFRVAVFIFFLAFACGVSLSFAAGEGRPRYETTVWYTAPTWLSNDRILCAKHIGHLKLHYGLLADLSKRTSTTLKSEIQLVSMKLDGTDEQIIKNIVITYKHGQPTSSEGALIGPTYIRTIDYNPLRHLIAFGEAVGERPGRLYLMNADGANLRKLTDSASAPAFSPNGRHLQYTSDGKIWLYDLDSGEHQVLIENATGGPWSPDGKRIIFSRKVGHRYDLFLFDLETGRESLIEEDGDAEDWSPDGQLLLVRGSLYEVIQVAGRFELKRVPGFQDLRLRDGRFSFDRTKMLGMPLSREGHIAIVDLQAKEMRVLR